MLGYNNPAHTRTVCYSTFLERRYLGCQMHAYIFWKQSRLQFIAFTSLHDNRYYHGSMHLNSGLQRGERWLNWKTLQILTLSTEKKKERVLGISNFAQHPLISHLPGSYLTWKGNTVSTSKTQHMVLPWEITSHEPGQKSLAAASCQSRQRLYTTNARFKK